MATIAQKALKVIEILTCNDDFTGNKRLEAIYKFSHIGVGHCLAKHRDWEEELNLMYEKLHRKSNKT